MTLQATYLGAQSIGMSDQNPSADTAYTIPITVASDGWLVAIEAALHSSAGTWAAILYADNAGAPGQLVALWGHSNDIYTLSTTDRWVTFPIFQWVTAGSYHIGVASKGGAGGTQLRTTTGGASGDGHTVDGNVDSVVPDGDYASAVITATTTTYSIRGVFITEAASGITGTLSETEAADSLAASGTHTPPAITGTVTETEAADSLAASGTFTPEAITGTLVETEADDTLSASGTFTPAGISGTLAETETDDTLSASGTHTAPSFTGTLTETEAADTLAASGSVAAPTFTGTLAETEETDSLAAVGLVGIPITGTLAETEEDDALSAFGVVPVGRWRQAAITATTRGASIKASSKAPAITANRREVELR